jgi:hypothetical protein
MSNKDLVRGYTEAYTISNNAIESGKVKCDVGRVFLYVIGRIIKIPLVVVVCILYILALLLEVVFSICRNGCEKLLDWISKI